MNLKQFIDPIKNWCKSFERIWEKNSTQKLRSSKCWWRFKTPNHQWAIGSQQCEHCLTHKESSAYVQRDYLFFNAGIREHWRNGKILSITKLSTESIKYHTYDWLRQIRTLSKKNSIWLMELLSNSLSFTFISVFHRLQLMRSIKRR